MRLDRRSGLVLIVLGFVCAVVTSYTVSAYEVARFAFDDGSELGWRYSPSGSFFPWPRGPGMAAALSKGNGISLFIYRYLIKSWILVGITVLLWAVTVLYFLKRVR